ncbi:hypothetical protein [Dactylosporangium sp. CA-139066]|uniref:hypothetical protein n=1 Tax=Dactylosporangium sp. CA-139066 TaxID=3239930 RepID=UPI003D93EF30
MAASIDDAHRTAGVAACGLAWIDDQLDGVVTADRRPRRCRDEDYTALHEDW